jgi:hypothetical protein
MEQTSYEIRSSEYTHKDTDAYADNKLFHTFLLKEEAFHGFSLLLGA